MTQYLLSPVIPSRVQEDRAYVTPDP